MISRLTIISIYHSGENTFGDVVDITVQLSDESVMCNKINFIGADRRYYWYWKPLSKVDLGCLDCLGAIGRQLSGGNLS